MSMSRTNRVAEGAIDNDTVVLDDTDVKNIEINRGPFIANIGVVESQGGLEVVSRSVEKTRATLVPKSFVFSMENLKIGEGAVYESEDSIRRVI